MAKVSKRSWKTPSGDKRTAFVLTYQDGNGQRHRKQFAKKTDADAERVRVEGQLSSGIHVPDKNSLDVTGAALAFLADFQALVLAGKRERSTLDAYERQVELHLKKYEISKIKLSRLSGPDCTRYGRALEADLSDAMATRVYAMFRQIIKFAQGAGWIAANPSDAVTIRTKGEARTEEDEVYIPPKEQLRRLYETARTFDDDGLAEAMVSVLMFAGLRASELRGLSRRNLFLADSKLKVTQRADEYNIIGPVKTKNALRTVPIPPSTTQALKHWLKSAPTSTLGLVFPTKGGSRGGGGGVWNYHNIYNRLWVPLLTAAELVEWADDGNSGKKARPFFALHTLRHVAVSLWIEQGATPKQVTKWAGHASYQFTQDTYGHLWSDADSDQAIARAAQASIIG
ncbi:tyrosine-type recombinase/integrase [Magnetospirillum sulfuroxidans]|uniref:Site-specific integrase n=1 Tax=Magnetospirillum sulfuroxidans TaxID=611300 RepID=A0ABS5I8V3_9PROT|nr:site-specific integrase [Magnetospirillum sulfuroxidans]MBR9970845.1 site-specific integrase [Magnetospirillum sulfuroxidans]